ncbi:hypothetical protein AMQ83_12550 [Paenibacillus riograndensis]|nr:hypothetical protein AMQ83_12550 [Paenibacillus riograndensis]
MYQITQGDRNKGRLVAGTGRVGADGNVGESAGVKYKSGVEYRKGSEIFYVPGKKYREATDKDDQIGTEMKLIPVSTLAEALKYMQELPVKS